jgi:hypothetical protein
MPPKPWLIPDTRKLLQFLKHGGLVHGRIGAGYM